MERKEIVQWLLDGDVSLTYQVHFEMEKARKDNRWNTLGVLRMLHHFMIDKPKYVNSFQAALTAPFEADKPAAYEPGPLP